jgi:hypothetical protein
LHPRHHLNQKSFEVGNHNHYVQSKPPPTTASAQTTPATPSQMMALITELHSEPTAQRSRIAQLTSVQTSQADQATPTVTASSSSIPKENNPPTFDGKSPPDSWIAHMTSYANGLTDEHAFAIAITSSLLMHTTGSLEIKLPLQRLATP